MKFTKPFRGVPKGEIYPVDYEVGEECPPELEAGAKALGAVGKRGPSAPAPAPAPAAADAPAADAEPADDAPAGGAAGSDDTGTDA